MRVQELRVTQAQLELPDMDRSDSRAVLVPVSAKKSEEIEVESYGDSNPHRGTRKPPHLPCLQGQTEAPESSSTGETPRAVRCRCDPFHNWKGWSTREFLYLAGPALLMSVAYLVGSLAVLWLLGLEDSQNNRLAMEALTVRNQ